MMRTIHVQVQPERIKRLNMAVVDAALRNVAKNKALVLRFRFEEGKESVRYMNFNYLTT